MDKNGLDNLKVEKRIRRRTYELHLVRGGNRHPLIDWLQPENEFKNKLQRYTGNRSNGDP